MSAPPDHIVKHALIEAMRSPCAKSKRGAVVFSDEGNEGYLSPVIGMGFNRAPGYTCDGSAACRASCSKRCLHAEQVAITAAIAHHRGLSISNLTILHVHAVNGELVGGSKPSCWQCSRLVYEHELDFWLYEANAQWESRECYARGHVAMFGPPGLGVTATIPAGTTGWERVQRWMDTYRNQGIRNPDDPHGDECELCGGALEPVGKVHYSKEGTWRRYSPAGGLPRSDVRGRRSVPMTFTDADKELALDALEIAHGFACLGSIMPMKQTRHACELEVASPAWYLACSTLDRELGAMGFAFGSDKKPAPAQYAEALVRAIERAQNGDWP